jgi:hypothetical protein
MVTSHSRLDSAEQRTNRLEENSDENIENKVIESEDGKMEERARDKEHGEAPDIWESLNTEKGAEVMSE